MSKKPVPSKKQAPSSTRSRHKKFAFLERKRIEAQTKLVKCSSCGAMKKRYYTCPECGKYKKRVVKSKSSVSPKPIKEIKA